MGEGAGGGAPDGLLNPLGDVIDSEFNRIDQILRDSAPDDLVPPLGDAFESCDNAFDRIDRILRDIRAIRTRSRSPHVARDI